MKKLRVVSLSNYQNIIELPKSIGNLIYLRYLNLSHTDIERLPSETCKLYNLQTLLLSGCSSLIELPDDMGKLVNLRHLDISGTSLSEMPIQIARLQNLQTLSNFVVSEKRDGLKVAELGKFPHIQGKLTISELQNVTDPFDTSQANLKMKEQIDELEPNWDMSQGSTIQSPVLQGLRPSTNLKNLTIEGYGGTSFPSWLGDSAFDNMVSLHISNCDSCSLLPPLGQSHGLKELYIYRMESVKSVGAEFYGSSHPLFQPFPSLEALSFRNMPEWEEWNLIGGTTIGFPSLRHLSLKECPKLKGNIPINLPSLIELELTECDLLLESEHSDDNRNTIRPLDVGFIQLMLPINSLRKLRIEGFPTLTSFPSNGLPKTLQSLAIRDCQNLEFLPLESLHNYTSLEDLEIFQSCYSMTSFTLGSLPVLKSLFIYGCKDLISIFNAEDTLSQSLSLQSLTIRYCENLEFLPVESLLNYTSLEDLSISDSCDSMTSFTLGSLPVLKSVSIEACKNLKSILIAEDALQSLSFLRSITIYHCDELESFSRGGMATPNLIDFGVYGCKKLPSLPEPINTLAGLQDLHIFGLPSLQSFAKEGLPINLRNLYISSVGGITEWGLERLTSLSVLDIIGDDIVKALMKMGAPLLPASLVTLHISWLVDIKRLDGKWLHHLTSLQDLEISFCYSLKLLPEEGLPSSLSVLRIDDCPLLEASWRRKRGKEWRNIVCIPSIIIDGKMIRSSIHPKKTL